MTKRRIILTGVVAVALVIALGIIVAPTQTEYKSIPLQAKQQEELTELINYQTSHTPLEADITLNKDWFFGEEKLEIKPTKWMATSGGVAYYKKGEEFKPIDLTLLDYGSYWESVKASYRPRIPKYADGWFEFRNLHEGNDHIVKTKPVANHTLGVLGGEGIMENRVVLYLNAFGEGIDLEVSAFNDRLSKKVIIRTPQTEELNFDFKLELPEEEFRSKNGNIQFERFVEIQDSGFFIGDPENPTIIYEMKVWDSGEKQEGLTTRFYKEEGEDYFRKTISTEFLLDAIYPIFTDADTGWTSPGTMANDAAVGDVAWNTPDNAKVSDDSDSHTYSDYIDVYRYSNYLKATNFGFSIPSGATIDGIVVEIEKQTDGATTDIHTYDNAVKIVKADASIGATDKSNVSYWPTSDTYVSHGAVDDLWGEEWTDTNINHSNFGVVLQTKIWHHSAGPCLSKNTEISTPDGYKNITDIKIGDEVFSFNEETKKVEKDIVVNTWIIPKLQRGIYYIYTDRSVVEAKNDHNFYVEGEWKRADELKVGDILLGESLEELEINKIEIIQMNEELYDLMTKNNHNYFANGVLVHNQNIYARVDHIRMTVYYTEAEGTNMQINIGDVWKDIDSIKINIGDVWKDVTKVEINIGDAWKTIF